MQLLCGCVAARGGVFLVRSFARARVSARPRPPTSSSPLQSSVVVRLRLRNWSRLRGATPRAVATTLPLLVRTHGGPPPFFAARSVGRARFSSSSVVSSLRSSSRQWRLSPNAAIWALIAVNGAVFLAWQTWATSSHAGAQTMMNHFTVSLRNLRRRPWTLLTSTVSQASTAHFFVNMLCLFMFGPAVGMTIGTGRLITLYAAGGMLSSLAHVYWTRRQMRKHPFSAGDTPALGASGATSAIVTLFGILYPKHMVFIYGIIPIPALGAVALMILWDLSNLNKRSRIAHAGHLGGACAGAVYALHVLRLVR